MYKIKLKEVIRFVTTDTGVKPDFVQAYEDGKSIKFGKKIPKALQRLLITYLLYKEDFDRLKDLVNYVTRNILEKHVVGEDYAVPEGAEVVDNIGGYQLIIVENMLCIQGITTFNIFTSPIEIAGIVPVKKEDLLHHPVYAPFLVDADVQHYQLTYGKRVWLFNDLTEAYLMQDLLISVKAGALLEGE